MPEVLNERISRLSREERAVLFQRLREKREREPAAGDRRERIERRPRPVPLPLSFAQQRLWFLDQLDPGQTTYNLPANFRLSGPLRPEVLAAALRTVAARHESLRTTFRDVEGRPAQVIAPCLDLALPLADLAVLAPQAREIELARLVLEDTGRPFDLAAGPLVRATLVRLGPEEHALLLDMHHIVSDGWSMGILVSEVIELYRAAAESRPAELRELPIQYADFTLWQREWLQGEELERQLGYWKGQLAGAPEALRLPADFPPPARPTPAGGQRRTHVDAGVMDRLQALVREERTTPFVALLSAFALLLSRWCGQEDVPVGTAVANRNRAEIAGLIGFFVNTLVLRIDLSGDPDLRELLRRAQAVALGAYAHQDLPFERLLEELQPDRTAARSPLFQAMLVLQNLPMPETRMGGLFFEPLPITSRTAKFEISATAVEGPWGLVVDFEYSRDLFAASTIERMAGHFARLLAEIAADPERRVSELPLLDAAERHQLLAEWNDTAAAMPFLPAHRLFAAQAERRPAALALVCGEEALAYGDLARRGWQVAHRLRRLGVEAETRVGLFAERSADLVAGLLGILAAGGAFVPLDPAAPRERLEALLRDSGPAVVLTQRPLLANLPEWGPESGARVLCLDDEAEGWAAEPADAPEPCEPRKTPGDLAYLIYTSGTTGRPKAVQVEHGNLASFLAAGQREFGWTEDDRMPALAPFAFDIFLFELLSPLAAGGVCELVPLRPALDLEVLLDALGRATRFHAVPALMRQVVDRLEAERMPSAAVPHCRDAPWGVSSSAEDRLGSLEGHRRRGDAPRGVSTIIEGQDIGTLAPKGVRAHLRTVFVGGDAVPPDLLAGMHRAFPRAEVRILYGPTEGTIFGSSLRVSAGALPQGNPAGRPLANVVVRVMGRHGELVPLGAPGEIWIGGAGVSRGYLHRDELTAERYVAADGGRWYRTGDLARWRPDGTLEFLGRIDEQVKVRGYRIELGEIESALAAHPGVREAAVAARPDPKTGDRVLIACVVPAPAGPDPDAGLTWPVLRAFLSERLPEPMIPAAGVLLDALPLTVHGKVDRWALARLGAKTLQERPDLADPLRPNRPYTAPRNAVEELLAGLWADVLGLRAGQRVGTGDNFFEMGGHSLLATQLVSRVRGTFQTEMPLRALFESPTVSAFAREVLAREAAPGRSESIARVLLRLRGMSAQDKKAALARRRTPEEQVS